MSFQEIVPNEDESSLARIQEVAQGQSSDMPIDKPQENTSGKKRILTGYKVSWEGGRRTEIPQYEWKDEEDAPPDKPDEYWVRHQDPNRGEMIPVSREEYYRRMGIMPPDVSSEDEKKEE